MTPKNPPKSDLPTPDVLTAPDAPAEPSTTLFDDRTEASQITADEHVEALHAGVPQAAPDVDLSAQLASANDRIEHLQQLANVLVARLLTSDEADLIQAAIGNSTLDQKQRDRCRETVDRARQRDFMPASRLSPDAVEAFIGDLERDRPDTAEAIRQFARHARGERL